MSSDVSCTPATMPSTTATSARPWDSPAVVHRNTRPIFARRACSPESADGEAVQDTTDLGQRFTMDGLLVVGKGDDHRHLADRIERERRQRAVRPRSALQNGERA